MVDNVTPKPPPAHTSFYGLYWGLVEIKFLLLLMYEAMKITQTAIVALSLFSVVSVWAAEKDTYSNPTIGFSVTKPGSWQFVSVEQNAENLTRTQFKDEESQKLVKKYATAPLIAMMKHPEPFDDLNPSFKLNIKPLGKFSAEDPIAVLTAISPTIKKMFEDFSVVTSPKETTVGGLKSAYMKIHYTLRIPDGRSFPACSEMWIVPRGKYFFLIGAGTRQDEKTGTRKEIHDILATIQIEKNKTIEPTGAGQPATKPADKDRMKVQPSALNPQPSTLAPSALPPSAYWASHCDTAIQPKPSPHTVLIEPGHQQRWPVLISVASSAPRMGHGHRRTSQIE